MTSAELAALADRCQLYGAWWPPFSPKCTIVSNSAARHRRQRRPVLCFRTPVLSVTSHSRMYWRWGRHCLHTYNQQTHDHILAQTHDCDQTLITNNIVQTKSTVLLSKIKHIQNNIMPENQHSHNQHYYISYSFTLFYD